MADFNFTTGPATLLDVGELHYNGCTFSPLFETKVSGKVVKDNASRTTKYMEYTITADGYATLPGGDVDINSSMTKLRKLLTAQGGELVYIGRGFDLRVNTGGGRGGGGGGGLKFGKNARVGRIINNNDDTSDLAWGPVPELIEFQPLGAGRSAKVQWKVVTHIPEIPRSGSGLLQFNYETTVSYGEDGFSSLSVRGTLEIGITRAPTQDTRKLTYTIDDYRNLISASIFGHIDLDKFRITRREFSVSRDKRILEWDVAAEERPYMDPPVDCTVARGTYNVRPAKVGMGLVTWLCTLKATYTVRNGAWRRTAWLAFLALVRLRMKQSLVGDIPELNEPVEARKPSILKGIGRGLAFAAGGALIAVTGGLATPLVGGFGGALVAYLTADEGTPGREGTVNPKRRAWLIDFSIDEGLYLDSKTISFSVTWRLISDFADILIKSGIWTKLPEVDKNGNNLWAASMRDISGSQSWLQNRLDPSVDVIVDFGGDI